MTDETRFERWAVVWSWLFPAIYLAHIAEEFWGGGGYSAYVARTRGVTLSPVRFLVLTGLGWALIVVGIILARKFKFTQWLMVCLSTVVAANGLSHTINSVIRAQYNPGLISGLLIFIPLGMATLVYLKRRMQGRRYFVALLVGIAIQGVVSLLAQSGGRSP
jgi:hypothetical protein